MLSKKNFFFLPSIENNLTDDNQFETEYFSLLISKTNVGGFFYKFEFDQELFFPPKWSLFNLKNRREPIFC